MTETYLVTSSGVFCGHCGAEQISTQEKHLKGCKGTKENATL